MKERIQKVLANVGVDSRRNVEQLVLMGRVAVNGDVVRELPVLIDPEFDKVEVDGEPVKLKSLKANKKVYILMNKPKGIYCTNVSQGAQKRAIDLLPPNFPYRVYPVGRLDADSRGLLLLTNDGELTNQLTHPRYGIGKTYIAEVEGYVDADVVGALNKGVWLSEKHGEGSRTLPSHVKILHRARDRSGLEIKIREGRNRQVRRMLLDLGHKILRLTRVQMGKLNLEGVGPGKWRFLSPQELKGLQQEVKRSTEAGGAKAAHPRTRSRPRAEGKKPGTTGKRGK